MTARAPEAQELKEFRADSFSGVDSSGCVVLTSNSVQCWNEF